jgi:hypothetical protein
MGKQQLINTEEFKAEAEWMLNELEDNRLDVGLSGPIDSTGRKCRVVNNRNPDWYRELFARFHNDKGGELSRSGVRRCRVLPTLKNLSKGVLKHSFLYTELFDLIQDRLFNGYEVQNTFVPPCLKEE